MYNPALLLSKKAVEAGYHYLSTTYIDNDRVTIPWSINVAQHLAPALFLALEFAVISGKFKYSRSHIAWITVVSVGYFAWMQFLFTKNQVLQIVT